MRYLYKKVNKYSSGRQQKASRESSCLIHVLLVSKAFQAQFPDGLVELKICDQFGFPLRDLNALKYAINVWNKSGCFYRKVEFEQNTSGSITSEVNSFHFFVYVSLYIYTLFRVYFERQSKSTSFKMKANIFWMRRGIMMCCAKPTELYW